MSSMAESEERRSRDRAPKARIDATPAATEDAPATPPAQDAGEAAPQGSEAPAGPDAAVRNVRQWLERTFPGNVNAVVFALVGFCVALLLFAIGLWRTLVLVVLVTAGVAFGQYLDGDAKIIRFLGTLFSNGNRR